MVQRLRPSIKEMIKTLFISAFLFTCLSVYADRQADYYKLRETLQNDGFQIQGDVDTVSVYKGYPIRIKQEKDSIIHIGLNLFNPELNDVINKDLLEYIERDLLLQIASEKTGEDTMIEFRVGDISDIMKIDPNSEFNIATIDSSILSVEWTLENGKHILMTVPISYDILRGGTRSEIEGAFISQLKKSNSHRSVDIEIDPTSLQPYRETGYVLPGSYYINDNIRRNIYLNSDRDSFIWDANYPLESINNLFICGVAEVNPDVDLTIMKHDYGEKEQIKTNIENLISIAEIEGCLPFWGLESYENGKVTGSLFLYNSGQGYDHVVKIECLPEQIILGEGCISAKAYLYIPSNNVSNLNEPYRVKTEDEKIKYWDN